MSKRVCDIRSRRGMTLVELIVAMAIAGVVLSGAFSIMLFGYKVFGIGNRQYASQSNIRLAATQLTDEIRYAVDIEILSSMDAAAEADPSTIPYYVNYIFYNEDQQTVVILNRAGIRKVFVQPDCAMLFSKTTSDDTIRMVLSTNNDGQNFSVDSDIFCLNMAKGVLDGITGEASGPAIRFTTNYDYLSSNETPLATITTNTPRSIVVSYTKNLRHEASITKIVSQGSLNANMKVVNPQITFTLPADPANGSKIIFEVGIYGLLPDNYSSYVYTLTYTKGTWIITQ